MAFYLVGARLRPGRVDDLRVRLALREFAGRRPFGRALTKGLQGARLDPATGDAVPSVWAARPAGTGDVPRGRPGSAR